MGKQPFGVKPWLQVEALEQRWVLDSALTQNQAFVAQAYLDLLNRPVDSTGLAAWSGLLDQGGTRSQVAEGIVDSPEFRTDFVENTYAALLHRPADSDGLQAWVGGINAGATFEQTEAGIAGAPEYSHDAGGTNAGFLTALYHDALGRTVDPTGQATWMPMLDAGAARSVITLAIYTSQEARQDLVQSYYLKYLQRAAEPAGVSFWINDLQSGVRDEDIVAGIVASQEYFMRDATPPAPPMITSPSGPVNNLPASETTFTITGTTKADSLVRIFREFVAPPPSTLAGLILVGSQQLSGGSTSFAITVPIMAGANNFSATATDPAGNTSAAAVVPNIDPVLGPPSVVPPANQTNDEGDVIPSGKVVVTGHDPEGSDVAFGAAGLPQGLSIDPQTGIITGALGPQSAGVHIVTVTLAESATSVSGSFTWTVIDITTPVVTAPSNQEDFVGAAIAAVTVTATDADDDPLTFSATGLPVGLSIDPLTGVINGTILASPGTINTVTVSASDGFNTGSSTFNWSIAFPPPPPSSFDQANSEGDIVHLLPPFGLASPNNYSAIGLPPGLQIDLSTGIISGTLTEQSAGTYAVTITDNNGTNGAGVWTFHWTVKDITTPVATAPPNQISDSGETITPLTVTATDADNDPLTFSVTGLPAGLTINPTTGAITGRITGNAGTTDTVTVAATDGFNTGTATFQWAIAKPFLPSPPGDQNNNEGDVVSLPISVGSDDSLTFSASGLPPGLQIGASTGVIAGTLTGQSAGSYTVTVTITDGTLVDHLTFGWTVGDITTPVVTAPPDLHNDVGDTVTAVVTATDGDGDTLTFSASSLPNGLTIDPATGVISGTVTTPGTYSVTVFASDGHNQGSASFNWDVLFPELLVLPPPNQANHEGAVISDLFVRATERGNSTFTFAADNLPPGLTISSSTGEITGTINIGDRADSPFTVTVSASDGNQIATATFTWIVENNTPPIVTSPGDQRNFEGDPVDIFARPSDPDGRATLVVSAQGLPAGLTIDSTTGEIKGTVGFQDGNQNEGVYTVVVSAFDGVNAGTTTFQWIAIDTTIPLVKAPANQANNEGDNVTGVFVTATDADHDPLTFSAANLPPGLAINQSTGEINGTVRAGVGAFSPYLVTIGASDGPSGRSTSFMWRIDNGTPPPVSQPGVPPFIYGPGDQFNNELDKVALSIVAVNPIIAGIGPEGGVLTYSAQNLPPGLTIDGLGNITGTLPGQSAGSYLVTVAVSIGPATASITFHWTVLPVATPIVLPPSPQGNSEGDIVALQVTATDTNDPLTYSATGLPSGLSIDPTRGLITGMIAAGASEQSPYTVTVLASNGFNTGSATFNWTIVPAVAPPSLLDQTNKEGDMVNLPPFVTWANHYSATGLPPGLQIDMSTGVISGTLTGQSAGTYVVTVNESNGEEGARDRFHWTVIAGTPVVTAPVSQTNQESDSVHLQVAATDANNHPLTYIATGLPSGLSIDPTTGLISGTIATGASDQSPYTVTVLVSNGFNTGSATFNWTIVPPLAPPSPFDQTNKEGDMVSLPPFFASDNGYSATGLPPGLQIDMSTGVVSGTLTGQSAGTYLVTVIAASGADAGMGTFHWTVIDATTPFVLAPSPQTNREWDRVHRQVIATDADNDSLTYIATGLPSGLSIDATTGLITGTIAAGARSHGPYTVTLVASDGMNTGSATFNWSINPALPGSSFDQTNKEGDVVNLGPPFSVGNSFWSATGLPPGLSIDCNTGYMSGTLTGQSAGTYLVTLLDVGYGAGGGGLWTFQWTVIDVTTPVVTALAPQTNREGDSVHLQVTATDNHPLTYSATGLPSGLSLDPNTGLISGMIATGASANSPYTVTVFASDGFNTGSATFSWVTEVV